LFSQAHAARLVRQRFCLHRPEQNRASERDGVKRRLHAAHTTGFCST
jgi:hypothetical protein